MPTLKSKQAQLRAINAEIAERTKYYREQETLIKETIEVGNTQIMGLHHDILEAKQELRGIKTDIRTAAQDKVLLNEDLENMRQEITELAPQSVPLIGVSPAFG